jgi:hypothetical protein
MTDALDCRRQADRCLHMALSAKDERVKSLLHDMARTWTILARQIERMDALRDGLAPYWANRH